MRNRRKESERKRSRKRRSVRGDPEEEKEEK